MQVPAESKRFPKNYFFFFKHNLFCFFILTSHDRDKKQPILMVISLHVQKLELKIGKFT